MSDPVKVATCCYCGTRAALVLRGDVQHQLSCQGCGATLHNIKHLKIKTEKAPKKPVVKGGDARSKCKKKTDTYLGKTSSKKPKKKKKKSFGRRLLGEVFDVVEDIFD